MQALPPVATGSTLTFRLSCGALLLMAFAQVICLGVALATRLEKLSSAPREVVREVVRYVPQPASEPAAPATGAAEPATPAGAEQVVAPTLPLDLAATATQPEPLPATQLPPPPPGLTAPLIKDPVVANLVAEARQARVAEDMRKAIIKLEQAEALAQDDPNVLYECGLVYEVMGIYDRASNYYQRVYELGTTGAGSLYELAAKKISVGFGQPEDQRGRLALGRARIFKDDQPDGSQHVVLTVPVFGAPGADFSPEDVEVKVTFFNQNDNLDIVPIGPAEQPKDEWTTAPVDWAGQGEELLQISYTIAAPDKQDAHLFGKRRYYGQVVELFYKGALIDSQAWPRHLAQKINHIDTTPDEVPMFLEHNQLPSDYNPQNPLLPLPTR